MEKTKIIPCVSIDWFQIHCKIISQTILEADYTPGKVFQIKKKDIRHNVFVNHAEVLSNITGEWEVCAVISYKPISGILPPDSLHLKVINKFLYQTDLRNMVNMLLIELKLKFKAIARLDIALDLKKFKRITVPKFFKQVIEKKYLKLKSSSIHIDGKATRTFPIHYMRFGSKTSQLQFYIYNKSKELREKTDKPYIREKWLKHGLNEKHYDIWRIEFVLHPSQFGVVDKSDGETFDFNNLEVTKPEVQKNLIYTLINQYAVFVHNDGQVRKERMKRVDLVGQDGYEFLYLRISDKKTSNRMDKVFIKKLYELNQQWRLHNKDPIPVDDLLNQFVNERDLVQWFNEIMMLNNKTEYNDIPENIPQQ